MSCSVAQLGAYIPWADISVVIFAAFTLIVMMLARTKKAAAPWFWLLPLCMLIAAQLFKIYTHKDSTFMNGNDSSDLWKFYGETFYEAMVVLWAALLGAVFISGARSAEKAPSANAEGDTLCHLDDKARSMHAQRHFARSEPSLPVAEQSEAQQVSSGNEVTEERITFARLLMEFRLAQDARSANPIEWKWLLPIPGMLLLTMGILIVLPVEFRELGWVRSTALATVLVSYLYGLWLLILPLRTLLDPVPELMHELDRRFEQESRLRAFLNTVPEEQRSLLSVRLERYMRRITGASRASQLAFILSPLFAFLLELFSQDGLGTLGSGSLLIGGAVLLGALIGIMQLRRAVVELESLRFSLEVGPR